MTCRRVPIRPTAAYSRYDPETRREISLKALMLAQVEYANKAVENSGYVFPCLPSICTTQSSYYFRTVIGLRVKDGVIFAVEKLIHSKLLVPAANRRIQTIDKHIGLVRSHAPLPLCRAFTSLLLRLRRVTSRMADISLTVHETKHPVSVRTIVLLPRFKYVALCL